jgi:hypothetical protein
MMASYRFINLSFKGYAMHFGLLNQANFAQLINPARIAATLEQRYPEKLILVRGPEIAGVPLTVFPTDPNLRAIAEEFNQAVDAGPSLSGLRDGVLDC